MFDYAKVEEIMNMNEAVKALCYDDEYYMGRTLVERFIMNAYNEMAERSDEYDKHYFKLVGYIMGTGIEKKFPYKTIAADIDDRVEKEAREYLERRMLNNEPYQKALAKVTEEWDDDDTFPEVDYREYLDSDKAYIEWTFPL